MTFQSALAALVPYAERAGIPWRRPDAYDQWDEIATALFESLVARPLSWYVLGDEGGNLALPCYDLLLETYSRLSTIEVINPALEDGRWLFHAFGMKDVPFDQVEARWVGPSGEPIEKELQVCPVEGSEFVLRLAGSDGQIVTELEGPAVGSDS